MTRTFILASILLGLSPSPALARTFYMSNAGNDNAMGTSSGPWATLNKANATMTSGDTLYIRGGVYSGVSGVRWSKSGTVNSPVVISAYPGEHPLFNGNGANAFMNTSSQYTIIDGLEITNYTLWAVEVGTTSSYVTIRNCYLHNILAAENASIVTSQCDHVTIENCVFEEMGRSLTQTKFDHAVYNSGGSHDITIRNNYFKNNYGGPAINNYHTPAPYNVSIYNNVFLMTKGTERSGVYAGTFGQNISLYNNTFYADGAGATTVYGINLGAGAGTDVAENNIFYFINSNIQNALVGASGNTVDYNLYYPARDPDDTGAHSLSGDPLFNSPGSDFHLTALSPARNNAVTISMFSTDADGIPRPAGAWDMGAYQYRVGTTADAGAGDAEVGDGGGDAIGAVEVPAGADGAVTPEASGRAISTPDVDLPGNPPVEAGGYAQPTQRTPASGGCSCTSIPSGGAPSPVLVAAMALPLGACRRRRR